MNGDDMNESRVKKRTARVLRAMLLLFLVVLLVLLIIKVYAANVRLAERLETELSQTGTDISAETPQPTEPPVAHIDFEPHAVEETRPDKHISVQEISVDGELCEEYSSEYDTSFATEAVYSSVEGVIAFRGGSFRQGASYGTAGVRTGSLEKLWSAKTDGLTDADGSFWAGIGWTGQPHIVRWPDATRRLITSMYDWARDTDGLVEVIYPCMDGCIRFYELDTGKPTREPMDLGVTFKSCGALDPRGYPILYLGAGVDSYDKKAHAFIINLIDNSVMYEFGENESFALRKWNMFDASPLICADTDQLVYPGENGVLYVIHLNSSFDVSAGEVSVEPDRIVKWRYNTERNTDGPYYIGIEASPAAINGYVFLADNSGHLMCLDLHTMKLVWVQDILDDTDCTPVIDVEDGHPYIYVSTSVRCGIRDYNSATVPVWKIDAVTGEAVWQRDYECYTSSSLSGGVQSTVAIGKNGLSDMIFVSIGRYPEYETGRLVALSKADGTELWHFDTDLYGLTSPLDFYDAYGKGYIIHCSADRNMYLLDGETGNVLNTVSFGGTIEASPAMYGNKLVMGHRSYEIFCVEVK